VRVLFIGDVVGSPGRRGLASAMPGLRERCAPDYVVVNGENSAGGMGITEATAQDIFDAGADLITTGNHVYRHRDAYEFLDRTDRVVRPANYAHSNPGRGHAVIDGAAGRLGVINLSGTVNLQAARNPFMEADTLVERLARDTDALLVDFHADVTSEKVAMGWHLDGRVSAVLGTHTHVPTADARVLPGGTAFITDVGMTGSRAGVIGVKPDGALKALITGMPARFETAEEDVWVMGACVEINADGRAESIEQILVPAS
jgi:metallophosphoesterase (TIGR00282 family)